jgi:hypothetical protein
MPDIIITPSSGKLEFINDSSQIQRRHSFTLDDDDGIKIDAPFRASSVRAPLNIINVTVDNSNTNYPFVLASGSAETGIKTLMMDGSGGTYNPFTNTATIDISGNSATTTLASNSTNLGGVAAASYVTLTGTQTLTNKTITGTFTGNLTGTGSWATNAVNANTATNATQLNGQAASYYQTALNGTGFVKISGTTISYDNSTYTPTSRTITAGTGISGGGDLSANRTIAVDDTVSRKYTSTINNVTSSAWTTVCNVVGDNLSSAIRVTFNGTSNSVVVNVLADILVNHFQDIIVYAISGFYSKLTIRIITNNDASFTLQVKHDGGTSTNLAVEIFPLNTETITFNPGTLFSTTTFDHICEWGVSTSGNGGNNSDIRTAGIFYGAGTGLTGTATNLTAGTATNSTQLNGQAASYYTNIPARLGYTPVNKAGDTISGNLTVNGNFAVNGSVTAFSASNIYITSSTLTVTDNILLMNALSPYQRYAGIQMYDSGSGTLSQFLWDGEGDYFFLTGSSVNGKIITGPDGQTNLTANYIPKATAGYKLGNSLIYDNGTNIGIGTTSPDALLNVVGGHIHVGNATAFDNPASWNRTILIDGTNHARLRVRATALVSGNNNVNEAYLWVDNSVVPYSGLYAGYGFKLETGNSTHITLFPSSGNVGIGVSSPTTALHVSGVISGSSFSGAGTGLTGTAASLTAGTATIANGVSTGAVKSGGLEENSVITSKIADGNVTNVKLASSSVTIGSSAVSLGSTLTTIAGLTSVTSTTFVGALTGNASTATNSTQLGGVAAASYVTLTGTQTLTNKTITGTFTGNLTGNASTSTTVNGTNGQLLTKDVRTIAPNNITNGYFQFGFTSWTNNNNSPYADYLHLRSYTDSSGGNDNLVMFRKDVIGMRIWQQTFGSATNYSSYKDVCWTDGTNASGTWAITSSWATNALNVNNATLTVAAGTGISLSATPTFTANASVDKTITITNGGVTSLTTNTGLSSNVSATGAVTVTNTGVTSITTNTGLSTNASATGAVTITNSGVTSAVAGTGVGVSGATGAVTFSIGQAVGTGNSPTFAGLVSTGNVGIGSTSPAALLNIRASAPTGIGSTPTGTNVLIDSNANNYITFRNTADNGTYAGLVFLDNNVGGYIAFGNAGAAVGSDSMIYGAYQDHIFQNNYVNETLYNRTETMRIKQSGNVGIGTSSPSSRVHIYENANRVTYIAQNNNHIARFEAYGTATAIDTTASNGIFFRINGGDIVKFAADGNVGIGTNTVTAKVESYFSSNAVTINYLATNLNNTSPIPVYGFDVTNGSGETRSIKAGIGYERHLTNGRGTLHFYNDSTNDTQSLSGNRTSAGDIKMSIDNDGNVGIGSVTPSYKLHVMGNGYFSSTLQVNSNITLSGGGDVIINDSDGTGTFNSFMDSGIGYIRIDDGGSANGKLNINSGLLYVGASGGNVGISSTTPGYKLDVVGDINFSSTLKFGGINVVSNAGGDVYLNGRVIRNESNTSQDGMYIGYNSTGTTNAHIRFFANATNERMRIQANDGNVGIGTTTAGQKLDVEGRIRTRGASGTGGFEIGAASSGAAKWRIEWDSASDSLDFNWVG